MSVSADILVGEHKAVTGHLAPLVIVDVNPCERAVIELVVFARKPVNLSVNRLYVGIQPFGDFLRRLSEIRVVEVFRRDRQVRDDAIRRAELCCAEFGDDYFRLLPLSLERTRDLEVLYRDISIEFRVRNDLLLVGGILVEVFLFYIIGQIGDQ